MHIQFRSPLSICAAHQHGAKITSLHGDNRNGWWRRGFLHRRFHHKDGGRGPISSLNTQNDVLVQSLCRRGRLHGALEALSSIRAPLSETTFQYLLKACIESKSLSGAQHIHNYLSHHRPGLTSLLGSYLVVALAKCGAIEDAEQLSHTLPERTIFSWTAIISAYVERELWHHALKSYERMQQDAVEPDSVLFVSLLKACANVSDLVQGRKLHVHACTKGITSDAYLAHTLLSMYGKCGAIWEAEDVFCALSGHTVVSWNVMLSVFVEQGQAKRALELYRQMQKEHNSPELLTFVTAMQACGILAEEEALSTESRRIDIGKALHADAYRKGYTCDIQVDTTLVSMYGKCGSLSRAENVFSAMIDRNEVSWSAMISIYVELGQGERALSFYRQMQEEGVSPNQLTILFAIQACGILAELPGHTRNGISFKMVALGIGRALHVDACRENLFTDPSVSSSLINLFGKCGALVEAGDLFDKLSQRNVVAWTAMLSAYVEQGESLKALQLYELVQKELAVVDIVIMVCILQACSEIGSLDTSEKLYFQFVSAGHDSVISVAATLIDAYGGCASMEDAQAVFDGIEEPSVVLWNACIVGHAGEGNLLASLEMFENLKPTIQPDGVTFTAILSACNHIGDFSLAISCFESMMEVYGVYTDVKHYGSIIDLLGRAGNFNGLINILEKMPMQADFTVWSSLLGACCLHGNTELAKPAFDLAVLVQPKRTTAYVLMSNLYANPEVHECRAEVNISRIFEGSCKELG